MLHVHLTVPSCKGNFRKNIICLITPTLRLNSFLNSSCLRKLSMLASKDFALCVCVCAYCVCVFMSVNMNVVAPVYLKQQSALINITVDLPDLRQGFGLSIPDLDLN